MKLLTHIITALAAATLTSTSVVKSPMMTSQEGNFELLILHNNDMHARFEQTSQLSGTCTTSDREAGKCYGGFPRVAYVVKEARRAAAAGEGPPVLYLNAGDTYTGTAWFTIYKWKIAAEFINALQPDAVSLGNHEFDNGVSGLTPFIENLTCPVLASNLVLSEVPELRAEKNLKKSVVFNINGTQVGVIGYLTPETKYLAIKNDVEYIDEISGIRQEAVRLMNTGVNILIALGHSGFSKDLEIAKKVEEIDLVIGGHTNTFLWNGTSPDSEQAEGPYPTIVKQQSGRLVPVVQAYAYTKYLGRLHLIFDSQGELVDYDGNPILLNSAIPQDVDVLNIVDYYKDEVMKISELIVGNTSVLLDGIGCKVGECNLGNMITDAMVHKYASEYIGKGWTGAPVAIIQRGGIRASISHINKPANITKGDLLTVLPFDGQLTIVQMNGTIVFKMLEHAVAKYDRIRFPGQFLHMSGIHVEYNLRNTPGMRVEKALIRCGACDIPAYFPVNRSEMYNILIPSFLSAGGDGFSMFNGLPMTYLNYNEYDATVEYVTSHSPVHPEVEGRIVVRNMKSFNNASYSQATLSGLLMSLGNHEFDEEVDGVVPFIRNVTAPVLAANLILDKVPQLKSEPNLFNSIVITKNGIKIGVIGYLTPETKFLAPKNKVEYEDEVVALRREVRILKEQDVRILIALGHSGFIKDLQIAKEVEDIDVVIGGHSNTFLWNSNSTSELPEYPQGRYPTWVTQENGRKVPVVQAYAYTKYMGKLHLIFDGDGEIIECDGNPILLNQDIPKDPVLLDLIEKYRANIDIINNEVVGRSTVYLEGKDCRMRECNIGNVITDAILYCTKNMSDQHRDANIAVVQGGRIRASIQRIQKPPIKLTHGDWITVLPFSDTLTIVTMDGSKLKQTLEHSVDSWRLIDTPGQFLQVSGIKVVYDLQNPPGSRVISAQAVCSNCSELFLTDVKDNYFYKMIMPTFLADGGDGYSIFEGLEKETLPFNDVMSVLYYLKEHSPIKPQITGRITILNENCVQSLPNININDVLSEGRGLNSSSTSPFRQLTYVAVLLSFIIHLT